MITQMKGGILRMKFKEIKPNMAKLDRTQVFRKTLSPTNVFTNIRSPTIAHIRRPFGK